MRGFKLKNLEGNPRLNRTMSLKRSIKQNEMIPQRTPKIANVTISSVSYGISVLNEVLNAFVILSAVPKRTVRTPQASVPQVATKDRGQTGNSGSLVEGNKI